MTYWFSRIGPVLLAAVASGCIVTDTIEFSDKVNHPPQVEKVDPPTTAMVNVCDDATYNFTVEFWDPDDSDEPLYNAKLDLWVNPYFNSAELSRPCNDPTKISDSSAQDDQGGVRMSVTCSLNLKEIQLQGVLDVMLVRVQVADRAYIQQILPSDARTAEVMWTLNLLPSSACQE